MIVIWPSITDLMDMNLRKLWEIVEDRGAWCVSVHGVTKSRHNLATEQKIWPKRMLEVRMRSRITSYIESRMA